MSIEEKAKAYDEAIEKAKKWDNITLIQSHHDMIKDIFPKLAESKDERIRKAINLILIATEEDQDAFYRTHNLTRKECSDWLEKQKDHISNIDAICLSAEIQKPYKDGNQWCILKGDNIQEGVAGFGNTQEDALVDFIRNVPIEKQKELHYTKRNAIFDKCVENCDPKVMREVSDKVDEMLEKEQKPAEYEKPLLSKFEQAVYDCAWGKVTCKPEGETQEEYAKRWAEQFLSMVRDWADDYIDFQIESAKRKAYDRGKADVEKPAEWSDNFEENIRILLHDKFTWYSEDGKMSSTVFIDDKTLKDIISGIWFYVGKEAIKYPNKELKSTEWSEEDEEMRKACIAFIADEKFKGYEKSYECMDWLKSLRPQPHWKPSEEQMEVLKNCAYGALRNGDGPVLRELYNDIKKLT